MYTINLLEHFVKKKVRFYLQMNWVWLAFILERDGEEKGIDFDKLLFICETGPVLASKTWQFQTARQPNYK